MPAPLSAPDFCLRYSAESSEAACYAASVKLVCLPGCGLPFTGLTTSSPPVDVADDLDTDLLGCESPAADPTELLLAFLDPLVCTFIRGLAPTSDWRAAIC